MYLRNSKTMRFSRFFEKVIPDTQKTVPHFGILT